jgi:hypothetical protein
VDPSDGCTFWAAQQYYENTSATGWRTRITEFRFPGCAPASGPTPPTVSGPTLDQAFQTAKSFDVTWTEPDPGSFTYDVRYREAPWGGPFGAPVIWQSQIAAPTATFDATRGSTYCFSARATDAGRTTGGWGSEVCTAVPLNDRSLKVSSGRWARKAGAGYDLGTFSRTSKRHAALTKAHVSAKTVALVATTCPGCGTIKVTWNGVTIARVSLDSATTQHLVIVPITTFSAGRFGKVRVVVVSNTSPVSVEGLGVSRV